MATKIPNTICKNRNCTKGANNSKKIFYSCRYCLNQAAWRSLACSAECHKEYMEQIAEARGESKNINLFPERTDMTYEEVKDIVQNEPIEEAIAITIEELRDELEEDPEASITEIVDQINDKIDKECGE